jgi:ABC-type sugar transport system ATPase subunit
MEPLIRTVGIVKHYGAVRALDGIDFELRAGEVLALCGDNGAGKSTLIKALAGAMVPDAGEIWFEGRRVQFRRPEDARALGIETVYQDLALFDHSNIAENIFAGREIQRRSFGIWMLDKKKMHEESARILKALKIRVQSTHSLVEGLSGGQRQTVAIGRAVAFTKRLVILDEPTAALGVPEQRKVLSMIGELKEQGYAIILISHNLEQVFQVADRIHVLRQGRTAGVVDRSTANPDLVIKLITGADTIATTGASPPLSKEESC